jgi:hypothetical protein
MRRVDGRKVTRLTPGDLAFCPEGQENRKVDRWDVRSQQEPYEMGHPIKGLYEVRRFGA